MDNDKKALSSHRNIYLLLLLIPGLIALGVLVSERISSIEELILKEGLKLKIILTILLIYFYPNLISFNYLSSFFYPRKIPGLSIEASFFVSLGLNVLFVFINIIGLSLVYKLFVEKSYRSKSFLIYFIFYIPCLMSDLVQYGLKELKMTPNIVWTLFVLEVVFLLLYIYIPYKLNSRMLTNGKVVLKAPVYLNHETKIQFQSSDLVDASAKTYLKTEGFEDATDATTNTDVNPDVNQDGNTDVNPDGTAIDENPDGTAMDENPDGSATNGKSNSYSRFSSQNINLPNINLPSWKTPNVSHMRPKLKKTSKHKKLSIPFSLSRLKDKPTNNYAISLWLSFNTLVVHENNPINIPVFVCGDIQINYKPNDKLEFQFFTGAKKQISVPAQRWNYIVFNYNEEMKVDLFLNGSLIYTKPLVGHVNCAGQDPFYPTSKKSMSIGFNNGELHGAICNVTLYKMSLTNSQIAEQYNLLHLQNPPINNLS